MVGSMGDMPINWKWHRIGVELRCGPLINKLNWYSDTLSSSSEDTSANNLMAIENTISQALEDMHLLPLKSKQFEAVVSFMSGSDTFVSLPTGYGKSEIYAILPKAFDYLLGIFLSIYTIFC